MITETSTFCWDSIILPFEPTAKGNVMHLQQLKGGSINLLCYLSVSFSVQAWSSFSRYA